MDPAGDLVAFLDGKTLAGVELVAGTNLFIGPLLPEEIVASPVVSLLNTGGVAPTPFISGSNREAYYRPSVQVLTRSVVSDFADGESLARAVFAELYLSTVSGYVGIFVRESQPVYLGTDASDRHTWTTNLEARYVA